MTLNDVGPSWRWLVGLLIAIAGALVGIGIRDNAVRVAKAETVNEQQQVELGVLRTTIEARTLQLNRIEAKLDRVLERGR